MAIRVYQSNSFSPYTNARKETCTLLYTDSAYALYDSHDQLMWRSDNIPASAMVAGSRHELLKNLSEEAQRYDYGVELLAPTIYAVLSPEHRKSVIDPSTATTVYPDVEWLISQDKGESHG